MLYVKKVIAMLRSVLHDLSINICSRSCTSGHTELLEVFTRISSSLDRLETDFSEFFKYYKEINKDE